MKDERSILLAAPHPSLAMLQGRAASLPLPLRPAAPPEIPAYLSEVYGWAYLRPSSLLLLDHTLVVSAILWGQFHRLKQAALAEIPRGSHVLQPACVYGRFSRDLAEHVGPAGRLDIIDIAPIQVENCRRKLAGHSNVRLRVADAAAPGGGPYDAICCFFLLHEIPDDHKRRVVDALLDRLAPAGRAVFIDYHRPRSTHPLKSTMCLVFDTLEPFAKALWRAEIASFASAPGRFVWRKQIFFAGLYQKVVAERPRADSATGRAP